MDNPLADEKSYQNVVNELRWNGYAECSRKTVKKWVLLLNSRKYGNYQNINLDRLNEIATHIRFSLKKEFNLFCAKKEDNDETVRFFVSEYYNMAGKGIDNRGINFSILFKTPDKNS